ncbi:MAG TPA: META domain-containing protein [Cellvibrionaceae bacterium]
MKAITKNGLWLIAMLMLGATVGGCGLSSGHASASPSSSEAIVGVWQLQSIGDRAVVENSPARIEFLDDGRIVGNASCNRFFGQYQLHQRQLIVEDALGSTKMMCLPELMEQEQVLLDFLPGSHKVTVDNKTLMLINKDRDVLRAVKVMQ